MLNDIFDSARKAGRNTSLTEPLINQVLREIASATETSTDYILQENKKDLERMSESDPKYDRLKLTRERLAAIAKDIVNVSLLPSPLGIKFENKKLPNGLLIEKVTVPLGVVGIIYEARPNVTFDVFALCMKSGNVCLLKGGSDAEYSNTAITRIIKEVLRNNHLDQNLITLLPTDRNATHELLNAVGKVDIIIPRGSQKLIDYVRENARVPVIETGAGIVHTYFDKSGNLDIGKEIIFNAKTRRVSVCNALDCLIVHRDRIDDLETLTGKLAEKTVTLYADENAYHTLSGKYPEHLLERATAEHFGTEFLDYKMSIKTVNNIDEALEHIAEYGSKHSEAIISDDEDAINHFMLKVDAAAVYSNASTAFTDGAQFGLGAEIGISTQKLHARGPMALRELTTYKWLIRGTGNIRD